MGETNPLEARVADLESRIQKQSDLNSLLAEAVRRLRGKGIFSHEELAEMLGCSEEPHFARDDDGNVKMAKDPKTGAKQPVQMRRQLFDVRHEPVKDETGATQHQMVTLGVNHHETQAELDKRLTDLAA